MKNKTNIEEKILSSYEGKIIGNMIPVGECTVMKPYPFERRCEMNTETAYRFESKADDVIYAVRKDIQGVEPNLVYLFTDHNEAQNFYKKCTEQWLQGGPGRGYSFMEPRKLIAYTKSKVIYKHNYPFDGKISSNLRFVNGDFVFGYMVDENYFDFQEVQWEDYGERDLPIIHIIVGILFLLSLYVFYKGGLESLLSGIK